MKAYRRVLDYSGRLAGRLAGLALIGVCAGAMVPGTGEAASSKGCEGGGFTVAGDFGAVSAPGEHQISFAQVGAAISVKGRYVEFTVVPASFGIADYLFTGAANPLDQTNGVRTVVWARKSPDHRGLILSSDVAVELSDSADIALQRSGPGLIMKIQAKDCANGGIFQMEVERADGTRTRFTHVLAPGMFYFDNPNFRAGEGDTVPYVTDKVNTVLTISPRINIANDVSPKLVVRDSAQPPAPGTVNVAQPSCATPIATRFGTIATVNQCGNFSQWDVASGGRMGQVTGEDATEVAPPPSNCVHKCQARNRVRGGAVTLGFPFPVPAESRLRTGTVPN